MDNSNRDDRISFRWMALACGIATAALVFAIVPVEALPGVRQTADEAVAVEVVAAVRQDRRPARPARPAVAPRPPRPAARARPVSPATPVAPASAADVAVYRPAGTGVALSAPTPPVAPEVGRAGAPVVAVEVAAQRACPPGEERTRTMTIDNGEGVRRVEWADAACEIEVRIEGEVTFNEDFTGFASISRGGLVRIHERGDVDRELEIRPGSNGLSYTYRMSGSTVPFDAEARAWLRGFVPELLRNSGIAAEERAAWLIATQGTDGLLREIEYLHSDRAQRTYIEAFLRAGPHDESDLVQVLEVAGRQLSSDRELAAVLGQLSSRDLAMAGVRRAFLQATTTLASDRELGRVLAGIMERGRLNREEMALVLASSRSISSDRELAGVLLLVIENGPLSESLRDPFMGALGTIASDREYNRVASALLRSESGG